MQSAIQIRSKHFVRYVLYFLLIVVPIISQYAMAQTGVGAFSAERFDAVFIENRGQWADEARFLMQLEGVDAWVTANGIVFDFYTYRTPEDENADNRTDITPAASPVETDLRRSGHVVKMQFYGAFDAVTEGLKPSDAHYNYFIGNDPQAWGVDAASYREVRLQHLYTGVAARMYGEAGGLRYDLLVAPESDPNRIEIRFDGAENVSINADGELVIATAHGEVLQRKLFAYQERNGALDQVECRFEQSGPAAFRFDIGAYDTTRELIIDPLVYSTYIGGISLVNAGGDIALDEFGNAYITGVTNISTFPTITGSYDEEHNGNTDVYVSMLDHTGENLLFSTFVGGVDRETGRAIEIFSDGSIWVTGITESSDFPTTDKALDTTFNGESDIFVFKLSPTGGALESSTFLGGSNEDDATDIAINHEGEPYVVGWTTSLDFPTTADAYDTSHNGAKDIIIASLSHDAGLLEYSTLLGDELEDFGQGIALDNNGGVNITGVSWSEFFPTSELAYDKSHNGLSDVVACKLDDRLRVLRYSTFIGGSEEDAGWGIALNADNEAYIAVSTSSPHFPTTPAAYDTSYNGVIDAAVVHVNDAGTDLIYSTFIGGVGAEEVSDISLDAAGSAYIAGETLSSGFPTTDGALRRHMGGISDIFVTKIDALGAQLEYSTYLGGANNSDDAYALAVDNELDVYIHGHTGSDIYPATNGAYNEEFSGSRDAVVSKIDLASCSISVATSDDLLICPGEEFELQTFVNGGDGDYRFRWFPEEGLSDPTSPNPLASPTVARSYRVTVSDAGFCEATAEVTVFVRPPLSANAGPAQVGCGLPVTFELGSEVTGAGGTGALTYEWTPDIDMNDPTSPNPIVTPTETRMYYLTVRDEEQCVKRDSVLIAVFPEGPTADAGEDMLICGGEPVQIGGAPTGFGGNGRLNYEWTPDLGLDDPFIANPILTLAPNERTLMDYTVRVTDQNGCTSTATVRIAIQPELIITAEAQDLCPGVEGALSATARGGNPENYIYEWSPSEGLSDPNDANPTIFLPVNGRYTYRVSVTDFNGCTAEDEVTVVVSDISPLSFEPDELDFGRLGECDIFKVDSLQAVNVGTDEVLIEQAAPGADFEVIAPELPVRLLPGERTTVIIRYQPQEVGPAAQWATFRRSPCGIVDSFLLRGQKTAVKVASDIKAIDYDHLALCDVVRIDTQITVRNSGSELISITPGILLPPFEVLNAQTQTIPVGEEAIVAVRYDPNVEGLYAAELEIEAQSAGCTDTLRIPLAGGVGDPVVIASVNAIEFGALSDCELRRSTTLTLTNPSNMDLTILAGPVAAHLNTSPQLPITLKAGDVIELMVEFKPLDEGAFSDPLVLNYEPCAKSASIDISGSKEGVALDFPDSVYVGETIFCRNQSAVASFSISRFGLESESVSAVNIQVNGPFTTTLEAGVNLPHDEAREFTVSFVPDIAEPNGVVEGELTFVLQPCNIPQTIKLSGIKSDVALDAANPIEQFAGPSDVRTIGYVNSGPIAVVVDTLVLEGLDGGFTIEDIVPALPATLMPGEALQVTVGFNASKEFETATLSAYSFEPCDQVSAKIELQGENHRVVGYARISIGSHRINTGETMRLPLKIEESSNLLESGVQSYEAHIRFNKTLLSPHGATPSGFVGPEERVISVSGELQDTLGVLQHIELMAMLGNDSCSVITLDTVIWNGGSVVTEADNGEFCLQDVCLAGGHARFFRSGPDQEIAIVSSNPISEYLEVEYSTIETGHVHLALVDMLGRNSIVLVDQTQNAGRYTAGVDASLLPTGMYMVVLDTITRRTTRLIKKVQ